MVAGLDAVIRIDAIWQATEPFAQYADHLPWYRLECIFARAGLTIQQSTLRACVGVCGGLQQLVDAFREEVLKEAYYARTDAGTNACAGYRQGPSR